MSNWRPLLKVAGVIAEIVRAVRIPRLIWEGKDDNVPANRINQALGITLGVWKRGTCPELSTAKG